MKHPAWTTIGAGVALVAASLASAADDVDLQVRGNELVDGTLRPADERESFLVDVPRGAKITATVVRKGAGAPTPVLDLLDASSAVVASGAASSQGAKLRSFETAGGLHRVRVAGDGAADGDYRCTVKVAVQTKWAEKSGASLAPGEETTFAFAAPAGSTATLTLTAAARSAFGPRIVDVSGPGGFLAPVDGATATPARHGVRALPLGPLGEYAVRIRNDGTAAGAWSISVKIAPPSVGRTNVDIRDGSLTGVYGGGSRVYGRVVDDLGALLDPPDDGGALDGCSVSVPATAVGLPSAISITASETFFVNDGTHAAGVAVSLQPAGLVFARPVIVTLPYDPQSFEDPTSELAVFIQNAETGALEQVDPSMVSVDVSTRTFTFPTSHFSQFQCTSPRPRPLKGTFLQIELGARTLQGFGAEAALGLNRIEALSGPRTGNLVRRSFDGGSVTFGAGLVAFSLPPANDGGVVAVQDDGEVTVAGDGGGLVQFRRGRSNDVLIKAAPKGTAVASVLLRVAKGLPTVANTKGRWHAFVYDFGAKSSDGHVEIAATGTRTVLEFTVKRTVTAGDTFAEIWSSAGDGRWDRRGSSRRPRPGKFQTAADGVTLDMNFGDAAGEQSIRLVPTVRGDVLIGSVVLPGSSSSAIASRAMILVRATERRPVRALLGRAFTSRFGLVAVDRPGAEQDFAFVQEDLFETRDGVSKLDVEGARATYAHDAAGAPTIASEDVAETLTYSIGADGAYREKTGTTFGAVVPRAGFCVTARFTDDFLGLSFGVVGKPEE